tara:strand:- start:56 stop:361 length:306 start_codon:yes stop_codon:yes gene_type:complete
MPEDTKIILDKESHKKNQIKYLIGLSPIIIYCVHYFTSPMNSFEDLETYALTSCLIILIHTGALYYTYLNWNKEKDLGLGLITSAILVIIILILDEIFLFL